MVNLNWIKKDLYIISMVTDSYRHYALLRRNNRNEYMTIGTLDINIKEHDAYLTEIHIIENERGRGNGKILLKNIMESLSSSPIKKIITEFKIENNSVTDSSFTKLLNDSGFVNVSRNIFEFINCE